MKPKKNKNPKKQSVLQKLLQISILSGHSTLSVSFMLSASFLIIGSSYTFYGLVLEKFGIETIAKVSSMKMERTKNGVNYHFYYSYKDSNGNSYNGDGVPHGERQDTIFITDRMKIRYLKPYPQYSSPNTNALDTGLFCLLVSMPLILFWIAMLKYHKI